MVVTDILKEAQEYCRSLADSIVEEHNKTNNKSLHVQVYFSDRLTKKYGYCRSYRNSSICNVYFSNLFIKDCWSKGLKDSVKELVIHEVSHAIVKDLYGMGHGHDRYFAEIVTRLGGKHTGRTAILNPTYKPYRYIYKCPNCNKEFKSKRVRKGACAECCNKYNNGEFTEKYKWVLVEDKGTVANW